MLKGNLPFPEVWVGESQKQFHEQGELHQRESARRQQECTCVDMKSQAKVEWSLWKQFGKFTTVPCCPGLNAVIVQGCAASVVSSEVEVGMVGHVDRGWLTGHTLVRLG